MAMYISILWKCWIGQGFKAEYWMQNGHENKTPSQIQKFRPLIENEIQEKM
jgi:hypothetical protein